MKKTVATTGFGKITRRLLPALLLLCFSFNAASAQGDFPSIELFMKATLKGEDRLAAEARGDLNGDGLEDWTGVINRQKSDSAWTYQLYVLLRLRQGGYRVAEKSREEVVPGMGCCWVEDLRVLRSSIYVQNNAKTASTMEAATHQFKLYKGEWRLVGVKIYLSDQSADASTETDMNLLTGAVIEKRQKGESKPVSQRRYRQFPASHLKDFNFSNGFGIE